MIAKGTGNQQIDRDVLALAIRLTFGFALGLIFLATVCGMALVV